MINRYNRILLPIFFIIDLLIVGVSFITAYYIRFGDFVEFDPQYSSAFIVILLIWSILSYFSKIYHEHRGRSLANQLKTLLYTQIVFLLFIFLYLFTIKGYFYSRAVFFTFYALNIFLTFVFHVLRNYLMKRYRSKGRNYKNVMLVGDLPNGNGNLFPAETGYNIAKHIQPDLSDNIGNTSELLKKEIKGENYDILLVASPLEFGKDLHEIYDIAEEYGMRIDFYPHFVKSLNFRIDVHYVDGIPLIRKSEPLKFLHNRIAKRFIDIIVAGTSFILFYWWFHLLVGAIMKFISKGPVLFKQKRVGSDGETFWMYKFRTMTPPKNEEKAVNGERELTKENDSRVTKIGECLRKSNLDELPQIINVLKGEMSIVGPRPHMLKEDREIREKVSKYMIRHFVKPGITGWAAINGYRGGTKDMEKMQKRIDHDIYYIEFWSPWLDLKIIGKTLWQMLTFNIPNAY